MRWAFWILKGEFIFQSLVLLDWFGISVKHFYSNYAELWGFGVELGFRIEVQMWILNNAALQQKVDFEDESGGSDPCRRNAAQHPQGIPLYKSEDPAAVRWTDKATYELVRCAELEDWIGTPMWISLNVVLQCGVDFKDESRGSDPRRCHATQHS